MKLCTSILFSILSCLSIGQISGTWHTSFLIMGNSNRMDLTISNYPLNPIGVMSDPDGSYKDVKMEKLIITDSTISFYWSKIGLSFDGKFSKSVDSIIGRMSQMDVKWGATFTRQEQEKVVAKRPQEPREPFAYPVEELFLKNGENIIAATLTLPLNSGTNYPIVVLASGSGPQDRNCELLSHKPFLVIADYLARNGIGSLRFDDRGVGKSTGVFQQASLIDFASDVKTCINFLANDSRFKTNPVGIIGHSEGGMHALMAAKGNKNVAFVIELASVGTSGKNVLVEQQYLVPKQSGKSEEYALWNQELYAGLSQIISSKSQQKATEPLNSFLDKMYVSSPPEYKDLTNIFNFKLALNMLLNNDWGRQFLTFETKDYLSKLKIPILAINGSQDIQVPAISNNKGFSQNFSKKSKSASRAIIIEGKNHLFQTCKSCSVMEYGDLEETFSEEVLILMKDWIKGLKISVL